MLVDMLGGARLTIVARLVLVSVRQQDVLSVGVLLQSVGVLACCIDVLMLPLMIHVHVGYMLGDTCWVL